MESILKYLLSLIALVAIVTGLNVLVGGAGAIPGATTGAEATIDNELRFFSIFWIFYGVFCFWIGRNLEKQHNFVPFIALAFFMGGLGRLISMLSVGAPADVLIPAMILEFVVPIPMFFIYSKLYKRKVNK